MNFNVVHILYIKIFSIGENVENYYSSDYNYYNHWLIYYYDGDYNYLKNGGHLL